MENNNDFIVSDYNKILDDLENLYPKNSGYYVFKRKKHDAKYFQLCVNDNKENNNIETLTLPAFPKYLLPPNILLEKIDKNNFIGEYFCDIDNISVKRTKNCATHVEKLIKYLNVNGYKSDPYIYSVYIIEKINKYKYFCAHLNDITQKKDNTYSIKSDRYTQTLQCYTVQFDNNNNIVNSEYGKI